MGPGAGFAVIGSFFSVLAALLAGTLSLFIWPFRWVLRRFRRRRAWGKATVRRVVVIGLDGLDPTLAEGWMKDGYLPHLSALRAEGSFTRLRTTYPSISPWPGLPS